MRQGFRIYQDGPIQYLSCFFQFLCDRVILSEGDMGQSVNDFPVLHLKFYLSYLIYLSSYFFDNFAEGISIIM